MEEFFLQRGEYQLFGVIENPNAEKIIIFVHGFTGDMRGPNGLFEKLSRELQKQGYAVCRFNCIGTPPSEGNFIDMTLQSEVEDTREVISYIQRLGYEDISLLGESMGGSIVTSLDTSNIHSIIFWYSAFDFSDCDFKEYITLEAKDALHRNGFLMCEGFKVGEKFIDEIQKIVLYDTMKDIHCPVLFLHGDSDSDVPYTQSQKAFDLVPHESKELVIVHGIGHCFPYDHKRAISETVKFLKKYE